MCQILRVCVAQDAMDEYNTTKGKYATSGDHGGIVAVCGIQNLIVTHIFETKR